MASKDLFEQYEYYKNYQLEASEVDLRKYLLPDVEPLSAKIQSGDFPTMTVLSSLQREKGEAPRDPNAASEPPFPPRRLKEEIFDAATYSEKDAYVRSVLLKPAETVEGAADRIFKMCGSNLDRVRAAFVFVCSAAVDAKGEAESVQEESEFYKKLRLLRADNDNCSISSVFEELVKCAGVPIRRIVGYKKGTNYSIGHRIEATSGSWFACYVDGEWRFVDPFWGSQSVSGYEDAQFNAILEDGSLKDVEKSEGTKHWRMNEFYFLTDPHLLILSHMPSDAFDDEWQLLVKPLSMEQFLRMPKFFSGFARQIKEFAGIAEILSHPLNVVLAAAGDIEICITEAEGELIDINYGRSVAIHQKDATEEAKSAIKTQIATNGYLVKPIRAGKTIKFKFVPPCPGKFMLTISIEKSTPYAQTVDFVSYVIHCPLAKDPRPRPHGVPQPPYFGPGWELRAAKLLIDLAGDLYAVDGESIVTVEDQRPPGPARRLPRCVLFDCANQVVSSDSVLVCSVGSKIFILFMSPDSGSFALVIQDGDTPLCQFLIDAPSEYRDALEFPLPNRDHLRQIGGLGLIDSELSTLIQPPSYQNPYIVCEESTMGLSFRMMEIEAEIQAELLHIGSGGQGRPSQGFAFVSSSSDQTSSSSVSLRFPLPGHYILRVNGRRGRSETMRPLYNYLIRALGEVNGQADQFPEVTEAWSSSNNRLVLPTQAVLPVNEDVPFAVSDKNASAMYLVVEGSEDKKIKMEKSASGLWKGRIKGSETTDRGKTVKVVSESGDDKNSCPTDLLKYRFESASDIKNRNDSSVAAFELNKRRQRNERLRKRKQENFDRAAKSLDLLPVDPGEPKSSPASSQAVQVKTMRDQFRVLCGPDFVLAADDFHKTAQAALLLLGLCEDETKTWDMSRAAMRKCLRQQVKPDADNIDARIAARAAAILEHFATAKYESRYAEHLRERPMRELIKWTKSLASAVLRRQPDAIPANRAQQLTILGVSNDLIEAWA